MKVLIAILTLLTFSMSGTYVQAKENRKQPPPQPQPPNASFGNRKGMAI